MITRPLHLAAKRTVDTAIILATAPLTLTLGLVTALLVRVFMGSPVIFRQTRIGLGERPFELLKFRSMLPEATTAGDTLTDAQRLTKFGSWLRKSSLDELPQLINVLRGDMSLIGPRPLLPQYVPFYTEQEKVRHSVRPGITGAAQVAGRNLLSWEDRLSLDAEYARHATLIDDARILFRTLRVVIRREGALADESGLNVSLDVHRSRPVNDTLTLHKSRGYVVQISSSDPRWLQVIDTEEGTVAALVHLPGPQSTEMAIVHAMTQVDNKGPAVDKEALLLALDYLKDLHTCRGAVSELARENSESIRAHHDLGFVSVDPESPERLIRLEMRW